MQIRSIVSLSLISLCGIGALAAQDKNQNVWTPQLSLQVKRVSDVQVSPDGNRTAFVVATAQTEGESSEYLSQIYLSGIDGGSQLQLTAGQDSSRSPRWSPDGRWIAFLTSREGSSNVWRIPIGGGEDRQLTFEEASISAFEWSPDGSKNRVSDGRS